MICNKTRSWTIFYLAQTGYPVINCHICYSSPVKLFVEHAWGKVIPVPIDSKSVSGGRNEDNCTECA